MQAPSESPLTLDVVSGHFQEWRRTKGKGERIPERLWREAMELVPDYGVSQVCRTLRLSGTDLNRRRGVRTPGKRRKRTGGPVPVRGGGAGLSGIGR
jgi:hypothetical protein